MVTFRINRNCEEFKSFVENDLADVDTFNIGYMFKGDLRSTLYGNWLLLF